MGETELNEQIVEQAFTYARIEAWHNAIRGILRRRSTALLSFSEIRARIQVRSQRDLGVQTIPIAQIIGSEGRADDFDRLFHPRSQRTKDRWKSIERANRLGRSLPPIQVYKLGSIYFVRDGNHRVSVARQSGQTEIEAHVLELKTDVYLDPEITTCDLTHIEEQSDFLEWTNLAHVRQPIPIKVTALGGYLDLIVHINQHRAELSRERGYKVERDEAIANWYDTVYLPVVTIIRQSNVRRGLRSMTEADTFLAVLQHQAALNGNGLELNVIQAAQNFVAEHDNPSFIRKFLRSTTNARSALPLLWLMTALRR